MIVVDRDSAEKRAYKMTIKEITASQITFVEFMDDILSTKEFTLQLVNEYTVQVEGNTATTTTPVSFKVANDDVTVCYVRSPVERNSWFALPSALPRDGGGDDGGGGRDGAEPLDRGG